MPCCLEVLYVTMGALISVIQPSRHIGIEMIAETSTNFR